MSANSQPPDQADPERFHGWVLSVPPEPVTAWRLVAFASVLDRQQIVYQIRIGNVELCGFGSLSVVRIGGGVQAKLVSEMDRPNSFEFCFHRFWLTRRGILELALACLESGSANDQWIAPTSPPTSYLLGLAQTALRRKTGSR